MKYPKLKSAYRITHLPNNAICIGDIGTNSYTLENPPLFFSTLLNLLDGKHTTEEIIASLEKRYPDEDRSQFSLAIQQMNDIHILEEAKRPATLSDTEQTYYDRQDRFFSLIDTQSKPGSHYQEILKTKTVAILGMGGYGCWLAQNLSLLGVKKILLIDGDDIELSNANRQVLFSTDDVGKRKADTAANKLSALNPFVEYEAINEYITLDLPKLPSLIAEADCVFLAWTNLAYYTDSELEPYLHQLAIKHQTPIFEASADPFDISIGPFYPNDGDSPTFTELREKIQQRWLKKNPSLIELKQAHSKETQQRTHEFLSPQYAPPLSIMAGMVVSEATKWLTGLARPTLIGKQFHLNLTSFESKLIDWN